MSRTPGATPPSRRGVRTPKIIPSNSRAPLRIDDGHPRVVGATPRASPRALTTTTHSPRATRPSHTKMVHPQTSSLQWAIQPPMASHFPLQATHTARTMAIRCTTLITKNKPTLGIIISRHLNHAWIRIVINHCHLIWRLTAYLPLMEPPISLMK